VILLSHPEFYKKNFDFIIKVLIDNAYLLDLSFLLLESDYTRTSNLLNTPRKTYFISPYISSIAKKFIQYFKNISFYKLAFICYNKFNKFIKVHKDPFQPTNLFLYIKIPAEAHIGNFFFIGLNQ